MDVKEPGVQALTRRPVRVVKVLLERAVKR